MHVAMTRKIRGLSHRKVKCEMLSGYFTQDEFMCDIEELMGGGQIQHWFDNEEKEYIVSAMKNRQDTVHENANNTHIWSSFITVSTLF